MHPAPYITILAILDVPNRAAAPIFVDGISAQFAIPQLHTASEHIVELETAQRYRLVIEEIAGFGWASLNRGELIQAAWAYYYFSVQFRESLTLACDLHPYDQSLQDLRNGECDTNNLSPFPGVAAAGERMNHDEFMRRLLALSEISTAERVRLERIGQSYLAATRGQAHVSRAMSIATYEDGGLETVFRAILGHPTGIILRCWRSNIFSSSIFGSTATTRPAMARCAGIWHPMTVFNRSGPRSGTCLSMRFQL